MTADDWPEVRQRFADALRVRGNHPTTVKQRLSSMDRLLRWHEDGGWRTVTPIVLNRVLARPSWTSPATRRVFQSAISVFYAWATAEGLIQNDPTLTVPKMNDPAKANVAATAQAIRTALDGADERTAMMIKLAYVAGMKAQEISLVKSTHVFSDQHGNWFLRAYRNDKDFRVIAIPPTLADELRVWPGYQFAGRVNGHVSAAYVSKLISASMPEEETAEQVRIARQEIVERNVAVDLWRDVAHFHSSVNLRLLMYPELSRSQDIQRHLDHISRQIESDPGGAIDDSKRLLESLFKLILADMGTPATDAPTLPGLYRRVAEALEIDTEAVLDDARASDAVKKALGGLTNTVHAVAELRNALDGHGRFEGTSVEPIQARLAFNATVTVSEYVAARWAVRSHRHY